MRACVAECDVTVVEPVRQPRPVRAERGPRPLPARRGARRGWLRQRASTSLFAPPVEEIYPDGFDTAVEVERALGTILEGAVRARAISAAWRPSARSSSTSSGPRSPTSGARTRSRWRSSSGIVRDLDLALEIRVHSHRPRRRRAGPLEPQRLPLRRERRRALALPRALRRRGGLRAVAGDGAAAARADPAEERSASTTLRSPTSTPSHACCCDPRGLDRLIDNVLLDEEMT